MADEQKDNQAQDSTQSSLGEELKKVEAQRDEYLNSWKRAAADFINYKKDETKRFSEMASYATNSLVKDLLPVLDSLDLGMSSLASDAVAQKGLGMIKAQFLEILKRQGVECIPVKKGDIFDPSLHEAMLEVAAPPGGEELAGKVVEEMAAGYTMNGRVIRAAKVSIGK